MVWPLLIIRLQLSKGQTYVKFLTIKVMKKIFFTAAIAVSGLVMVSCDADPIVNTSAQAKDLGVQKTDLKFNESHTIPLSSTSTPMASDGPGDEIIIIKPPKKP